MYKPNCDVFWPGSYPFKDPAVAIRRILKNPVMLLHWPQLPRKSTKERMLEQAFRALFGGRKGKPKDDDLTDASPGEHAPSAFTKGTAAGWTGMWLALGRRRGNGGYFKTQMAGPITLTSRLQSKLFSGRTVARREKVLLQYMSLWLDHAYWQIAAIKNQGFKPIVVLDEPLLPTVMGPSGSAQARKILRLLRSTVTRLKKRGALVGVHCCNRVSPAVLISTGADLIHFDACHFTSQITQHRAAIQEFFKEGGIVAWGVVPTTEGLTSVSKTRLEKNLADLLASMETRGLPLSKVLAQSMVGPTCGTGFLTAKDSDEIMNFSTSLARQIKSRYKL